MAQPNIPSSRFEIILTWIVIAFFAVAIPLYSLNQPGGPVGETVGVIQSSGFLPSDIGPPAQIATVRLKDGSLIRARVVSDSPLRPGYVDHIHILHHVISGSDVYEIFRAEPPS